MHCVLWGCWELTIVGSSRVSSVVSIAQVFQDKLRQANVHVEAHHPRPQLNMPSWPLFAQHVQRMSLYTKQRLARGDSLLAQGVTAALTIMTAVTAALVAIVAAISAEVLPALEAALRAALPEELTEALPETLPRGPLALSSVLASLAAVRLLMVLWTVLAMVVTACWRGSAALALAVLLALLMAIGCPRDREIDRRIRAMVRIRHIF